MSEYDDLQQRLGRGWNTWNVRSVLSHVKLPEAVGVNLALRDGGGPRYLRQALVGSLEHVGETGDHVHPGPHAYDGSYTRLQLHWSKGRTTVESAVRDGELFLLITPQQVPLLPQTLVVEPGMLWNRPGTVRQGSDRLVIETPGDTVEVFCTGETVDEPNADTMGPYLAVKLDGPVAVSTGSARSLDEVRSIVAQQRQAHEATIAAHGDLAEVYAALQSCLAWDTIYDPTKDRVISPVSRGWSVGWGGYVLFEWDTYFAAWLAAIDGRDLAYANAVEITREMTEQGFVPNFAAAGDARSRDRSQPPVGAITVRFLYRRFGDHWLLKELFDALLTWNRWWPEHRDNGGLLSWGSDPYEPVVGNQWETHGVNERFGAALESGLDNSPMYDDIPFDAERHVLELQDVGLTSLYVADCRALAELADELGRGDESAELRQRGDRYAEAMERLWHDPAALYLNRRTDTGEFAQRLSPTHFYPLIAEVPDAGRARHMVEQHLLNPAEFWGRWVLPSIARSDPAYGDQQYWRGRIWAPMNFLVYLGLRNYDLPEVRRQLAERSTALLLKEWNERGHVHENYNADTGEGCDVGSSDCFYHWGGLLGLIAFLEAGKRGEAEA